ncbi:MAG: hypothetical protein H0U57_11995 [Tatlockia sp.]|nr:hypothetical protein [Tatlockia sp.]
MGIFKEKCIKAYNRTGLSEPLMWWGFLAAKAHWDFPLLENFWFLGPLFPPFWIMTNVIFYLALPIINIAVNGVWALANLLFSLVWVPMTTAVHLVKDYTRQERVNEFYDYVSTIDDSQEFDELVTKPINDYQPSSGFSKDLKRNILKPEIDKALKPYETPLMARKIALFNFFKPSDLEENQSNAGRGITSQLLDNFDSFKKSKIINSKERNTNQRIFDYRLKEVERINNITSETKSLRV